ncbi:hypothetical protein [Capnocytophaga canimorsus]|uniref:hypothetical protein n=1 Tax=Capnocytophaga canimorsus TaxID=28188 RepID=UPI001AC96FEA|nr:hypothetical protein [Capnocytophaga canimorsus]GIM59639.1 hypothetical protein CAPN007_18480 [Capnocytophaga canimorsus]
MSLPSFSSGGYTYFKLKIACPVCRERGITTPQTFWVHAYNNCGGEIYIGDNACYYCKKCNHYEHIRTWKYKCPQHSTSDDDYVGLGSVAAIAEVVSCAGMMVSATGQQWLIKCLENLGDW